MIKKSIFVVLAMFGLSSVANDMQSESDHMSDMIDSSEESSFMGAVELKYKALGTKEEGQKEGPSYRARLGWKGDVNEQIKWGVGLSSNVEQYFSTPSLVGVNLEQAYVSYMPVEGFHIKAGKYGWKKTKFNKTGVLYDDDLYTEGVSLKYRYGDMDDTNTFFKVALQELDEKFKGPFAEGTVLKLKVGGHYALSEELMGGVYVSAEYDGLFIAKKVTPKTLAQVGVNVTSSSMEVPVGAFGVYVTDVKKITANHSFNAGLSVGNADSPTSGEMSDFGVSVSYYDIKATDHNTALVDTDYVAGAGKGVAVRAQYNVWNNTNLVAKYARNLGTTNGKEANNLVGELTFNF